MKPAMVLFSWAAHPGHAGVGAKPALRRAVRRHPGADRLGAVLDPPRLSRRADPVALPPDPSLGRVDGLAGGITAAPGRRRSHARIDVRADLSPGLRRGAALRVYRVRQHSGDVHPRQRPLRSSDRSPGSWRRRSSTTGTTGRNRRPSTRTSRCTCRSSTGCSARSICQRAAGRHRMGSRTARRCPKGTRASSFSRSRPPVGSASTRSTSGE